MKKELVWFTKEKVNGFRGFKYRAFTYSDEKGHQLDEKNIPEGTDVMVLESSVQSLDKSMTDALRNDLLNSIEGQLKNLRPLYEI